MSKAETTPLTAPHEWAAVEEAFDRIMTTAESATLPATVSTRTCAVDS